MHDNEFSSILIHLLGSSPIVTVNMADEEPHVRPEKENTSVLQVEDVFINGDSEDKTSSNDPGEQEHMDTINVEPMLPRKSSFMNKDGSRRHNRKKTVSFSSMPTERKIATGACFRFVWQSEVKSFEPGSFYDTIGTKFPSL